MAFRTTFIFVLDLANIQVKYTIMLHFLTKTLSPLLALWNIQLVADL